MKKIIVTGCNGQLGRAVNLEYADSAEYELVNTDVGELDITKVDDVMKFVRDIKPYAIINCAAYTAVEAITSEEYGAAVKRPAYSILDNYMFRMTTDFKFADWHDAIAAYLKGEG